MAQGNTAVFSSTLETTSHDRLRVMRNTYGLLALSMLPTIAGAWIGVEMGLAEVMKATGPLTTFFGFLVLAFGLIWGIKKNQDSGLGVALLLLFTGFMGAMLAPALTATMAKSDGANIVALAAGTTAGVFAAMNVLAYAIKRDISSWGKFLFVGLVMLLMASLANLFLQSSAMAITISTISVGLFSAYLLYDLKQVIDGGETNYVSATLSIYLDLINIFSNLLSLLGLTSSD